MSSLVVPFHDPKNIETNFFKQIIPTLKENFDNCFVSITPKTVVDNPAAVEILEKDPFFITNRNAEGSLVGEHFLASYKNAVEHSNPDQVLHLCNTDRVAFALANYRDAFLNDLRSVSVQNSPVLFERSPQAWSTHPKNYYAAESMVTEAGRVLFGKKLDFTWCHFSITAKQLKDVLPKLTAKDLLIASQLTFYLKDIVKTKEVDWLSWEDPFVLGKDPIQYKLEKETDPAELEKRMGYVLPEIKFLFEEYKKLV